MVICYYDYSIYPSQVIFAIHRTYCLVSDSLMTHYRFFFGGHCTISRPFARTICSNDRDHHGRTLEQLHHSRSPDLPPQSSQKYVERPFRGEVLSPWSGHHAKSPLRAALPLHRAGPTGGAGTPASWSSPGADPLSQCAAALSLSLSFRGCGLEGGVTPVPQYENPPPANQRGSTWGDFEISPKNLGSGRRLGSGTHGILHREMQHDVSYCAI